MNLVKNIKVGDAWPIKNYNNMVMEMHIVDASQYKTKRRAIDPKLLERDGGFKERNLQFYNQQYYINKQKRIDNMTPSNMSMNK